MREIHIKRSQGASCHVGNAWNGTLWWKLDALQEGEQGRGAGAAEQAGGYRGGEGQAEGGSGILKAGLGGTQEGKHYPVCVIFCLFSCTDLHVHVCKFSI